MKKAAQLWAKKHWVALSDTSYKMHRKDLKY